MEINTNAFGMLYGDFDEHDLFEFYDEIPEEVQAVLDEFALEELDYDSCANLVKALNEVGYTCDYGLDAQPFGLKKL